MSTTRVYSFGWIYQQGLNGATNPIEVPDGHVYVVKQLTAYSNPFGQTSAFFEDVQSGAALWSAFFNLDQGGWQGFYGHLVFMPGSSFRFRVNATLPTDAIDVSAHGYDLLGSP